MPKAPRAGLLGSGLSRYPGNFDLMRIGIDIGGTFTDLVLFDESTAVFHSYKLLSTPHDPAQAVLAGLAGLIESFADGMQFATHQFPLSLQSSGLSALDLSIVHGSTVATNALLERKGARTALVTTAGFGDLLSIGRQTRTHLYNFFLDRPEPLVQQNLALVVSERVDYLGQVLQPLDTAELPALVQRLRALGAESVAICLLFSFLYPAHEEQVASVLRAAGFFVSASHEILPEFREYERASTTVINAYVSPVLDRYIGRLEVVLQDASFRMMQSNGGSIGAGQARREAVRSILSGPAGGVVGAYHVAQLASFPKAITFDMGGTSTDVALCDGGIHVTSEAEIDGLPIGIPVIDIHTVGAGGGSIAYGDKGGALRVGPQSAGADPGPACYGHGGMFPTVTDANLMLGRLAVEQFLGGRMTLDLAAAEMALSDVAHQVGLMPALGLSAAQTIALGIVKIANAHMERALRVISVERGHDPGDFVLVSFGGAGGLHACDLARALGIRTVLMPPGASTLSAFGMLTADVVKDYVQTVMLPGTVDYATILAQMEPLIERGHREVAVEGVPPERIVLHRELDVRYAGQSYELTVPLTPGFASGFHGAHRSVYGHSEPTAPVEIVNLRLRVVGSLPHPPLARGHQGHEDESVAYLDRQPVVLASGVADVPFFKGERLQPGHVVAGPAVIIHEDTTIFLEQGDLGKVDGYRNLVVAIG